MFSRYFFSYLRTTATLRITAMMAVFLGGTFCSFAQKASSQKDDSDSASDEAANIRESPFARGPMPQDPFQNSNSTTGEVVAVWELQHPISSKGVLLIQCGLGFMRSDNHDKALQVFTQAFDEPTASGYALANLGVDYLRLGNLPAALSELEEGARLLPGLATGHSNLAYALCLSGQGGRAEDETLKARAIDKASPQTQFVMGMIEWDCGLLDLQFAQNSVRGARLALAVYHARLGKLEPAQSQLQEYLSGDSTAGAAATQRWIAEVAALPRPVSAFGFD